MRQTLLPLLVFCLALPAWSATNVAGRYAKEFKVVDDHCVDWQFCRDKDLPRLWRLAGEFLSSRLSQDERATADDLVAALRGLDRDLPQPGRHAPSLDASAMKLANGDFVVALQYFETGAVLIVGRSRSGGARMKWSIADALPCWRPAACGPYFAAITPLPSTADGEPRFLVEALHAGNGMTVGAQTSAWRWDGATAHLLAIDEHAEQLDDERQTKVDGHLVVVPTKEIARSFISSGASRDPAGTLTLRLTANGAKNLGHRWADRELRWLDDFLTALHRGRPTDRFATPQVAHETRRHLDDLGGMLMEWHVDRHTLYVTMDSEVAFTFDPAGKRPYAVGVRFEEAH